jgi:hypothetical protein
VTRRHFTIQISDGAIAALRQRLENVRWPSALDADSWDDGASLSFIQGRCATAPTGDRYLNGARAGNRGDSENTDTSIAELIRRLPASRPTVSTSLS